MSSDDPADEGNPSSVALLDRLLVGGVLVAEDSETLTPSAAFRAAIGVAQAALATQPDNVVTAVVAELTGRDDPDLLAPARENPRFLAIYLALGARTDFSVAERRRVVAVLDSVVGRSDAPRDDGAPEPFLPVRGGRLPLLLAMYPRAVVYAWREDCPPCDAMREVLAAQLTTDDRGIGLFAVYGPDFAPLLSERYDVEVAPTTLFVVDGVVDARLVGAHEPATVGAELDILATE
jgi:thiol-disulfide isomerase/thioredoxin